MTDIEDVDLTSLGPEQELGPVDESITERLKRQHKEESQRKTVDLDIPGFDGGLFCRYRLMTSDELEAIVRRVRQSTRNRSDQITTATMDNLIGACEEFFVRDNGQDIPLSQVIGKDTPVQYDMDLAKTMDFADRLPDPPTARSILLELFAGNDIAMQAHGARLSQWMMRAGRDMDELLGGI
jgi:hypothetical protein